MEPTDEQIAKFMEEYANDDAQGAFIRLVKKVWAAALEASDKAVKEALGDTAD